ncbi:MAG TPA: hypothetical protein VGG39_34625 [Polyangiaceae bacterium]|jgi:hypothetical protein
MTTAQDPPVRRKQKARRAKQLAQWRAKQPPKEAAPAGAKPAKPAAPADAKPASPAKPTKKA